MDVENELKAWKSDVRLRRLSIEQLKDALHNCKTRLYPHLVGNRTYKEAADLLHKEFYPDQYLEAISVEDNLEKAKILYVDGTIIKGNRGWAFFTLKGDISQTESGKIFKPDQVDGEDVCIFDGKTWAEIIEQPKEEKTNQQKMDEFINTNGQYLPKEEKLVVEVGKLSDLSVEKPKYINGE